MKSLLFKQQIWQGKSKALATYGEAVTRRLCKFPFESKLGEWEPVEMTPDGVKDSMGRPATFKPFWTFWHTRRGTVLKLPFQSGEIVYLREAFAVDDNGIPVYRSNYGATEDDSFPPSMFKWQSPYAMSEALARTFFRIKDVRPERLQAITAHDCELEGYPDFGIVSWAVPRKLWFLSIWDSTCKRKNGVLENSWEQNPWVWRISFEQAERPGL